TARELVGVPTVTISSIDMLQLAFDAKAEEAFGASLSKASRTGRELRFAAQEPIVLASDRQLAEGHVGDLCSLTLQGSLTFSAPTRTLARTCILDNANISLAPGADWILDCEAIRFDGANAIHGVGEDGKSGD